MTTIAVDVRAGKMASDSRISCGDAHYESDKLFVCPDGSLIGIAGYLIDAKRFVRWMQDGADENAKPQFADDYFTALVLNASGLSKWDSNCIEIPMNNASFYAIGSGGHVAMGAMHAGASVERAIEIAGLCDSGTGGATVVKEFKPKRARAKKRGLLGSGG